MPEIQKVQCRNGCGTQIFFHEKWKSKSGKPVPIEEVTDPSKPNGKGWKKHDCPKSSYQAKGSSSASAANSTQVEELKKEIEALKQRVSNLEELLAQNAG